jgi:hypothetical protein
MSKLSLSVAKLAAPASGANLDLNDVDRYLAVAGDNVPQIRALEVLAEAAKEFALNDQQKKAAMVAKLKIARHGGQALKRMAERGERKTRQTAALKSSSAVELDSLGVSKQRSSRWQTIGRLSDEDFDDRLNAIWSEDPDTDLGVVLMGGLKGTTGVEWYTPAKYIEAARSLMGGIDLDPASSAMANETVKAETWWGIDDADEHGNGSLQRDWFGRVWLNPPYGKGSGQFTLQLVSEFSSGRVEQAVLLLNAYGFDSDWFDGLWDHPICFTDHRIEFYSPKRESGGPANGNIFVYLGTEDRRFAEVFGAFGTIVRRWP